MSVIFNFRICLLFAISILFLSIGSNVYAQQHQAYITYCDVYWDDIKPWDEPRREYRQFISLGNGYFYYERHHNWDSEARKNNPYLGWADLPHDLWYSEYYWNWGWQWYRYTGYTTWQIENILDPNHWEYYAWEFGMDGNWNDLPGGWQRNGSW